MSPPEYKPEPEPERASSERRVNGQRRWAVLLTVQLFTDMRCCQEKCQEKTRFLSLCV